MTTPPHVTSQQVSTALKRIHARHRAADDPHAEELTMDPAEVLAYLRKRGPHHQADTRAQDLYDAAALHLWLWWEHQTRERWLLDTAASLDMHMGDVGQEFGLGKQGLRDRRDRLRALLDEGGPHRPDEKYARGLRAGGGATPPVGALAWLERVQPTVLAIAGTALQWWPRVSEDTAREMVDLRDDVRSGRYGPAMWDALADALAALAVDELEEARRAGAALLEDVALLAQNRAEAIARAQQATSGT